MLPCILYCFILSTLWLFCFSLWQSSFLGLLLPFVICFVTTPRKLSHTEHVFKPIGQHLCPRISLIKNNHPWEDSQGALKEGGAKGSSLILYICWLNSGDKWNKRCEKPNYPPIQNTLLCCTNRFHACLMCEHLWRWKKTKKAKCVWLQLQTDSCLLAIDKTSNSTSSCIIIGFC